jgi:hypothetical protein
MLGRGQLRGTMKRLVGNMFNMLNEIDQMQLAFVAAQKLIAAQVANRRSPVEE